MATAGAFAASVLSTDLFSSPADKSDSSPSPGTANSEVKGISDGRRPGVLKAQPVFSTPANTRFQFTGFVGQRLKANLENWELRAPDSNPALVEMFYDRDRKPDRQLLPWSGEFVGKFLCASILSYRILRDPRQKAMIDRIVRSFIESQGPDGYLGPFDRENRLIGKNWDVWGHYWAIRALLMYHREFGSQEALQSAMRAADLLVKTFLNKGIPLTNDGSHGQMNYAVIHAFTDLYIETGKPDYLQMARWIVSEWDKPGAGNYMQLALAGREMYEFPGNRWESLHDFLGMLDMYLITGEPEFSRVFTNIWWSILKGDRHNTGGFTTSEHTTGDPYDDKGPIETCCTVGWIDMSVAMLKLTGASLVADEIELSTFNGNLGGQNPAGNWWTYNTPMNGTKEASAHSINFQCRAGSPELNCCAVNGPRGLGLLTEWAVMRSKDGVVLNYYGPSRIQVPTPGNQVLTLEQKTDYPVSGSISINVTMVRPEKFELKLRVPAWSAATRIAINGKVISGVKAGTYQSVMRDWKDGDRISLDLDMSMHYWVGDREMAGRTSIYHGPLLLTFDPVYNTMDPVAIPVLDALNLDSTMTSTDRRFHPWVLMNVKSVEGRDVTLCDFATAGAYGNYYRSWLTVHNVGFVPFDPDKPIWSNRL
jgi:DUF1680 family protein